MNRPAAHRTSPGGGLRFHYAWIIVVVTFVALLAAAGTRTASGVLIKPLEEYFGWDRASVSLAASIGLFVFALAGPLGGSMVDRFGPRRMMGLGLTITVIGVGPLLLMRDLWQLYLFWGLVTGIGTGAISGTVGAVVAARWFNTRRGLIVGIFSSATSMGQLVFVPVLMGLTVTGGWRSGIWFLTGLSAILFLPVVLLMRDFPAQKGLRPVGDQGGPSAAAQQREDARATPMREAVRKRDFWLLAGSFFVCGYTSAGLIGTHLIPHALERGFDETTTASTVALVGAMNMAGTLLSGLLTDRFDNRRLLAVYYSLRAVSLLALPFILNAPQLVLFAVVYGLDSVATVPPTANLTTTIFGKGSLGTVYGWLFFSHMTGAAIAAYSGGYLHELLGSYTVSFLSAALMGFVAAGFCLGITVSARRKAVVAA